MSSPPLFLQPLSAWQVPVDLIGVFTDIDDTLTTEGAITADALESLAQLKAAGLYVVPITGRPAGWSERFAVAWPVDALVAENGAVALRLDTPENLSKNELQRSSDNRRQLSKVYQQDASTRGENLERMQAVLADIEHRVPGARRATDSAGRETDIAIDHSEFTQMAQGAMDECVAIMRNAGMNATVSSIHINGWFGDHNKWHGAQWIVRTLWGRDLAQETARWVYVGDSTNDQVMFEHFEHSVGVANVARFLPLLQHLPRYVTRAERGAGFAELAQHLLAARA